jgi:hypothetical protein
MSGLSKIDVARLSTLSTIEAALMYASNRVSIIPVEPGDGKKPLISWSPYQRQVPSRDSVDRWFTRQFPGAAIGIVAGKLNGILVVDLDNDVDADFFFERFPYAKQSRTIKTPHGLHVYFEHRDRLNNHVGLFARKIDLRTTGGYVRAPTSPGYTFFNDGPILPPPGELVAALTRERNVITRKVTEGDPIPEGFRNDALFRIGCALQASGYADAEIVATIEAVNAERVVPPLPRREIESICRSVMSRYPKGRRSTPSPASLHRVSPGYYICEAKRHYSMDWKNRQSHVIEWRDIATDFIYRQFFNQHHRFSPKSKAVINYYLLFGEYPKRLDRIDFARFIGTVALVHVVDSRPTVGWAKDFPDLCLPTGLTESRVDSVVCALSTKTLSTKREGEGR